MAPAPSAEPSTAAPTPLMVCPVSARVRVGVAARPAASAPEAGPERFGLHRTQSSSGALGRPPPRRLWADPFTLPAPDSPVPPRPAPASPDAAGRPSRGRGTPSDPTTQSRPRPRPRGSSGPAGLRFGRSWGRRTCDGDPTHSPPASATLPARPGQWT